MLDLPDKETDSWLTATVRTMLTRFMSDAVVQDNIATEDFEELVRAYGRDQDLAETLMGGVVADVKRRSDSVIASLARELHAAKQDAAATRSHLSILAMAVAGVRDESASDQALSDAVMKFVADVANRCTISQASAEYQKDVNRKLEQRLLAAEDENVKLKSAAEARNEEK